ncbi:MAG: DUF2130 domain-containing protein [Candidatus Theseobacter exili]|nr:DUF2130 domain-containing protein [Candidatus Theseobacter exili]
MTEQVIICPYCKREIPLTEAISHQIREQLLKDFEAEREKAEKLLDQKNEALRAKEKELEDAKKSMEEQITQKVKAEKEKIEVEIKKKVVEESELKIKDLIGQVEEKDKKLQESQKAELELRKQRRELEESKKNFELEMARKIDEERNKIRDTALKTVSDEYRLKDLEKEKQISDMRKQIEELKRRAEQGSQQMQGEVLELDLEDVLRINFPLDEIAPVPKGIRGADILQKVHNQTGQYCGTVIWESKRTKAWSDGWMQKLRDDQREVHADIAVILSIALPKDVNNFAFIDGIWVTDYSSMIGLVTALRINLIQVAMAKLSAVGKQEKMEVLYNYLSGQEFRQRVEAIVEAFVSMKGDLDKEKRAMNKIWSKREKQIERVVLNTSGMYGDMQGIIGASLPEIKSLELETSVDEIEID